MDENIKGGRQMARYNGIRKVKNRKGNTYEISYKVDGKRYQYRITADSQKEADHIRAQDIARQIEENKITSEDISEVSIARARDMLIESVEAEGKDKKTIYHYKRTFKRLFVDFKNKQFPGISCVNHVTVPFLNRYKTYFVNETGNTGLWAEVTFVKAMIRRLIGLGLIRRDFERELKEVKKPAKGNQKEFPLIPTSKFKKFFETVKKERPDIYPLLFYVFKTGRRILESTLIERKDLEMKGFRVNSIRIKIATTKQQMNLPLRYLDDELSAVLYRTYCANKNKRDSHLFINRTNNKFHTNRVRDYLADVSQRVLGERITPHYFRHRVLTLCAKHGVGVRDSMALAGLTDINVALRYYTHETEEGIRKGYEISKI